MLIKMIDSNSNFSQTSEVIDSALTEYWWNNDWGTAIFSIFLDNRRFKVKQNSVKLKLASDIKFLSIACIVNIDMGDLRYIQFREED